jgi:hypothetical protein
LGHECFFDEIDEIGRGVGVCEQETRQSIRVRGGEVGGRDEERKLSRPWTMNPTTSSTVIPTSHDTNRPLGMVALSSAQELKPNIHESTRRRSRHSRRGEVCTVRHLIMMASEAISGSEEDETRVEFTTTDRGVRKSAAGSEERRREGRGE